MQKTISQIESEAACQNSTESASDQLYQTAFASWQQDTENVFSFCPPNPNPQTVFLEGIGMQKEDPAILERRALQRISNHFGILFLHQLLVPYFIILVCILLFSFTSTPLSYSLHDMVLYGSDGAVLITIILQTLFRFGVPLFIAAHKMKMPREVTFCHQDAPISAWLRTAAVTLCIFSVFGGVLMCFPETIIQVLTLGTLSHSILCMEPPYQLTYFLFILLCRPIFETILYHGSMLHVLRQFGDDTAVLLTAIFSAMMSENLLTGISAFALSLLAGREILRHQNILIGLFARYIYYILIFFGFHISIFQNDVPLPGRNIAVILIGMIGMLLCILLLWKAPFKGKKRFQSIRSTGKCCLTFLIQANLMTFCMFVAFALLIVTSIL